MKQSLKGIDTSHYSTAQINTNTISDVVKNNELYFNYIKASDGIGKDPTFADNWRLSRSSGLICGAYHFFRPLRNPSVQAHNFLDAYAMVGHGGALPMTIDVEWTKNNAHPTEDWDTIPPAERAGMVLEFMRVIEAEQHVKPFIYTAKSFWHDFFDPHTSTIQNAALGEYELWIVDLKNQHPLPLPWANKAALLSQTHLGETATTNDPYDKCDQDCYNGNLKELLNKLAPGFTLSKAKYYSNIARDMQDALTRKGFDTNGVDGYYGGGTEAAVQQFQQANGLFANGIIDAQTWNKLLN
jgi:lysozyme